MTDDASRTIEARWTVVYDDYLATCRADDLWRPAWRRSGVGSFDTVMTMVVCLITAAQFYLGNTLIGGLLLSGILLIGLVQYVVIPAVRRRAFDQQDLDGAEMSLSARDDGLALITPKATSTVVWSAIKPIDQFENGTILWLSRRQPLYVPDHGFPSSVDADQFRQFLKEKTSGSRA
ncbi:MAG: YcxB family protein [Pseudomonadota bacterium]